MSAPDEPLNPGSDETDVNGTSEVTWLAWDGWISLPLADIDSIARPDGRTVIFAVQVEDVILACGGLLASLAALKHDVLIVTATPWFSADLPSFFDGAKDGRERWVAALGVIAPRVSIFELQPWQRDAAIMVEEQLAEMLAQMLLPTDTLLAPWLGDGTIDREAAGRAAQRAAGSAGCLLVEYPLWVWRWSFPEDPRFPWDRAAMLINRIFANEAKAEAIGCLERAGPLGNEDALHDGVLRPFRWPFEVYFF